MANFFYFMHIPWGWIKQRPHFLAEELSDIVSMNVFVPKMYRKSSLVSNKTNLSLIEVFKLPFEKYQLVREMNYYIVNFFLKYIYSFQSYRYIWLTDLRLYPYIKKVLDQNQILIYDCMDDILEFDILQNRYIELKQIEIELFRRVNFTFFSSREMCNRKNKEYQLDCKRYEVIYNAFDRSLLDSPIYDDFNYQFDLYQNQNIKVLTYIGTISNWFDFQIIEKSLHEFDQIVYFMVGPIEQNTEILKHERVIYFGPVEHKYVKSIILHSDALIMPFKVNKLIEAVDPVKIYEYIALGANILSIKYKELDKFGKYISLYENYDEFRKFLKKLHHNEKINNIPDEFIQKNNWSSRKKQILLKLLGDL